MTGKLTGIVLGALMATASATAAPADHYGVTDLTQMMETLKAKAATSGSASVTLATYPNHHTMLAYRTQDGGAELHAKEADVFTIVRGKAAILTEGTIEGAHASGPDEIRGTKVVGGKTTELKEGDVIHIPAGTPHQMLVSKGNEVLYFVVKVKEHD